jgi:hypothetical protein
MSKHRSTILLVGLLAFAGLTGLAQSNTGRLIGTIATADGVVSGATVVVKDNKTGKERTVTANEEGVFVVPQLEVGAYTVKVSVAGFKTYTVNDVKIDVGREYSLPVTLEVGRVEESVTVSGGVDVLNATTAELSNTVSQKQILELPLNGRNPMNLLLLQPGVSSNSAQNTSINGMRTSFTNITRDGLNIQDGFIRSNATDFAPGRPSVDDTGEFTVVTQNAGADQNGGAQIRLVTPRGENKFHGSLFEFNRNSELAANDFFSNRAGLDVPFLNRNNFGGKIGGPMPIPRFGEGGPAVINGRAFFFFSYEGLRQRSQSLRDRTILTESARNGVFTYNDNSNVRRTIPILSLVSGVNTIDPIVQDRILSKLPAVGNNPNFGDSLNTTGFSFRQPNNQDRNIYTTRLDYDISERHSINGVFTYNKENNLRPDVDGNEGFTPLPVIVQSSTNKLLVLAYRWTPGSRFTNEVRGGLFRSGVPFDRTADYPAYFIGFNNTLPLISNPEVTFPNQGRNTRYYNFQDTAELTWGSHSLRFGGQFQIQEVDAYNEAGGGTSIIPAFGLGVNPNTPQLSAGMFPGGISATQLNNANGLFALLGGIVSSGNQAFNVEDKNSGFKPVRRFEDFVYGNHSLFAQDQWRVGPSLTLNLGLRYELFTALKLKNGLALEPVIGGKDPLQAILDPNGTYNFIGGNAGGDNRYSRTDKNNFAPILSFAYTPKLSNSFVSKFLGSGQTVLRGGYRMSYLNDQMITALRNATLSNVGLGTTAVSATVNNSPQLNARLNALPGINPPPVVVPRTYAQNNGGGFGNFGFTFAVDPDLQTPRVQEYNFGIQREFGANAIEIRYVGGRSDNLWRGIDYNQIDITNNGFAADFLRARANLLAAEIARQTNPSIPLSGAFNPNVPGSVQLTVFPVLGQQGNLASTAVINHLRNGTAADLAFQYIQAGPGPTGTNGFKFLPNPNTGQAMLLTNGSFFRYNSLQLEFRRRFSKGLYLQSNYTFQKNLTNAVGTAQNLVEPFLDNARPDLEVGRADFDTAHIFRVNGVYELPFGNGRKFLNGGGRLGDLLFGGWQVTGIVTFTTGAPMSITDQRGNFNRATVTNTAVNRTLRQTALTSLTKDQIKNLIGIRKLPGGVFFIDPRVININPDGTTGAGKSGRGAEGFGVDPFTGQVFFNNEPGQTSGLERMFIDGPNFFNVDASVSKRFNISETVRFQLRLEAFNALNRANFGVTAAQQFSVFNVNSANFGRITNAFAGRIVQIGGRLDF